MWCARVIFQIFKIFLPIQNVWIFLKNSRRFEYFHEELTHSAPFRPRSVTPIPEGIGRVSWHKPCRETNSAHHNFRVRLHPAGLKLRPNPCQSRLFWGVKNYRRYCRGNNLRERRVTGWSCRPPAWQFPLGIRSRQTEQALMCTHSAPPNALRVSLKFQKNVNFPAPLTRSTRVRHALWVV
jgi:hypothetical protein